MGQNPQEAYRNLQQQLQRTRRRFMGGGGGGGPRTGIVATVIAGIGGYYFVSNALFNGKYSVHNAV